MWLDSSAAADLEIWTATRESTSDPFSMQEPVTELNTIDADRPAWISADGCRLYVSRGPTHTMYVAARPAS